MCIASGQLGCPALRLLRPAQPLATLLHLRHFTHVSQSRKGNGSQPTSHHGTPEPDACSDDQQLLAAAVAAARGRTASEEQEVSSACALAPEAAVEDLKG